MSNLIKYLTLTTFILIFSNCSNDPESYDQKSVKDALPLESRGVCDNCYNSLPPKCCCVVTLDQLQTIDLQICGVSSAGYWNISNCNMDTGDGCYDVSSVYGIHRTLTGGFPIYFCVTKGTPFSLYNMNGSGQGNILLDCNGSGDPQGGQMLNLSYDDGSFVRYIQSDSNCDLEPCPY